MPAILDAPAEAIDHPVLGPVVFDPGGCHPLGDDADFGEAGRVAADLIIENVPAGHQTMVAGHPVAGPIRVVRGWSLRDSA